MTTTTPMSCMAAQTRSSSTDASGVAAGHQRARVVSRVACVQGLALLLVVLGDVSSSQAQLMTPDAKRDYQHIVRDALQEYGVTNFAEAYALFEQAHQLRPSARTWRCLGMTSFELRQYVRSQAELRAALSDARQPLTSAQHAEVVTLLDRVSHYIGMLAVHTKPSSATVVLDGQSRQSGDEQMTVNLGEHDLMVRADGYQPVLRKLLVEGGKLQSLEIELTPLTALAKQPDAAPPTPQTVARSAPPAAQPRTAPFVRTSAARAEPPLVERWWFWTAVGVVAAGAAVAVVALTSQPDSLKPEAGTVGGTIVALGGKP